MGKMTLSNKKLLLVIALLLGLLIIGLGILFINRNQDQNTIIPSPVPTISPTASLTTTTPNVTITPVTELQIEDLVVGTGVQAVAGKSVTVNYLGTLQNGTKFDSSYDHGTPFSFQLGAGEVIQGWDKGVLGMKVGGKRKLTIPPDLGYGTRGAGNAIPPNATLIFEVELLNVE
jgi:FKBP-type peptidyl-prolyl cis-trans isomerase